MERPRPYYSHRSVGTRLDFQTLVQVVADMYLECRRQGHFQQAFGYVCVDAGKVPGVCGADLRGYAARRLRRDGLWPIEERYRQYSEADLFDVLEFLHDHISKPLDGQFHGYNDCGWHYSEFDRPAGRQFLREEVNPLLVDYGSGYELSPDGEVLSLAPGFEALLDVSDLHFDPETIDSRIRAAERKFRRYGSSLDDQRDAVRALADVLERVKPRMQGLITKNDESDLFQIVNRFGIRHHDIHQRTDYDQEVWLPWMFYYYLATVKAVLSLISKRANPDDLLPF